MRHTRIACWLPKAADTLSEYIIHIALPRQQWLRERTSVLRYTLCTLPDLLNHLHCIQQ
jgi:hypothetical protein